MAKKPSDVNKMMRIVNYDTNFDGRDFLLVNETYAPDKEVHVLDVIRRSVWDDRKNWWSDMFSFIGFKSTFIKKKTQVLTIAVRRGFFRKNGVYDGLSFGAIFPTNPDDLPKDLDPTLMASLMKAIQVSDVEQSTITHLKQSSLQKTALLSKVDDDSRLTEAKELLKMITESEKKAQKDSTSESEEKKD